MLIIYAPVSHQKLRRFFSLQQVIKDAFSPPCFHRKFVSPYIALSMNLPSMISLLKPVGHSALLLVILKLASLHYVEMYLVVNYFSIWNIDSGPNIISCSRILSKSKFVSISDVVMWCVHLTIKNMLVDHLASPTLINTIQFFSYLTKFLSFLSLLGLVRTNDQINISIEYGV